MPGQQLKAFSFTEHELTDYHLKFMLNFHSSSKKSAFNAVYAGELSELRLEMKPRLFSHSFPLKSWFLSLSTKNRSPHTKGTKDMNIVIKRSFCKSSLVHAA